MFRSNLLCRPAEEIINSYQALQWFLQCILCSLYTSGGICAYGEKYVLSDDLKGHFSGKVAGLSHHTYVHMWCHDKVSWHMHMLHVVIVNAWWDSLAIIAGYHICSRLFSNFVTSHLHNKTLD